MQTASKCQSAPNHTFFCNMHSTGLPTPPCRSAGPKRVLRKNVHPPARWGRLLHKVDAMQHGIKMSARIPATTATKAHTTALLGCATDPPPYFSFFLACNLELLGPICTHAYECKVLGNSERVEFLLLVGEKPSHANSLKMSKCSKSYFFSTCILGVSQVTGAGQLPHNW
jgi:hypothetical protein